VSRHKSGNLERKILKFHPLKDGKGRFIPFCDYGFHQGIVKYPEICEKRHCNHYQKLYINQQVLGRDPCVRYSNEAGPATPGIMS
jgi:hypothetical protein